MIRTLMLIGIIGFATMFAAACNSDGSLKPTVVTFLNNVVTAECQVDQAIPGLVAAGGQLTVLIAPEDAPAVAMLSQADAIIHPIVVAACTARAAGSVPVKVTVTQVP